MNTRGYAKTSVVVAAWDAYAGPTLGRALGSLLEQDWPFELIVVDNASRAPLPPIGHAADVVRQSERVTLGEARNLGLARVRTPYVIFWDADDLMLPGTMSKLETTIEADPRLVLFAMAICESPSGKRHRWPRRWLSRLVRFPRLLAVLQCVWSQFPTTGATIIRTAAARAGGGFADAESGEDWCLGASLAFRGRVGWSEEFGRSYRLDPQSVWAQHLTPSHQRRHAEAVRQRLREDIGVPGWARLLEPVIGVGQHLAIAAHTAVVANRTRTRGSGRRSSVAATGADDGRDDRQRQQ